MYNMQLLNKLSKYTVQLILLFLLNYTLVFFCSLMICNSTTDEILTSHSVYILFMKNSHVLFIFEFSNKNERGSGISFHRFSVKHLQPLD